MQNDFSEIKKLGSLLNEANIPYESIRRRSLSFDSLQIWYPSETFPKADVVVLYSALDGKKLSYGAPLLEMRGLVDDDPDSIRGSMTAEEVFAIWKEDWNNANK